MPTWTPYQFMGAPTASLGTYALTYPPTYAAYAIARFVLQNEYATLEVFCLVHLLVGYAAMYWTCRVMGIRVSLAVATSVCFCLSGYFLIVGRSWYYMTPVASFAPLLVGLVERFRRGQVGGKWILATAAVLGLFFHAGNVQMWIYATMFFIASIGALLLCSAVPWSRVLAPIAALLLGAAVAMPLLLPQHAETSQSIRTRADNSVLDSLPSMFLPYPLAKSSFPVVRNTPDADRIGQLYYSGTILSVVALIGMLSLIAHRWTRRCLTENVWLLMAWLALLSALGYLSPLWQLMSHVPPLTGLRHPFKFVAFITLFMLVGGAVLAERALKHWKIRYRTKVGLITAIFILMAYHAFMSTTVICQTGSLPYPDLPTGMQALRDEQPSGRLFPVAPIRGLAPEYALSMMNQIPTLWQWPALFGYDPLVSDSTCFEPIVRNVFGSDSSDNVADAVPENRLPQSLKALMAYGVRWVVVYEGRKIPNPPHRSHYWHVNPELKQIGTQAKRWGKEVVRRREFRIYELEGASPLAFPATEPSRALSSQLTAGGMTIDTSTMPNGGDVVVNTTKSSFLTATIDGVAQTARQDEWGRLVFSVFPEAKQLRLAYRPPWLLGGACGAVLALLGAIAICLHRRLLRNATSEVDQINPSASVAFSQAA